MHQRIIIRADGESFEAFIIPAGHGALHGGVKYAASVEWDGGLQGGDNITNVVVWAVDAKGHGEELGRYEVDEMCGEWWRDVPPTHGAFPEAACYELVQEIYGNTTAQAAVREVHSGALASITHDDERGSYVEILDSNDGHRVLGQGVNTLEAWHDAVRNGADRN